VPEAIVVRNKFDIVATPFWPKPRICGLFANNSIIDQLFSFYLIATEAANVRLFLLSDFYFVLYLYFIIAEANLRLATKALFVPFSKYRPFAPVSRGYRRSKVAPSCKLKDPLTDLKVPRTQGALLGHTSSL
jgi:hypothetical protein